MVAIVATVYLALLGCGVITALKGKWGIVVVGLFLGPAWILGAVRLARPGSLWARRFYDEDQRRHAAAVAPRRRMIAVVASVAGLAVVGGLLAVGKTYRIPSSSMEPTLLCSNREIACSGEYSDRVFAVRRILGWEPARGDVVAYEMPEHAVSRCGAAGTFVHRVVAVAGERISGSRRVVSVDGKPLAEPYVREVAAPHRFGPVTVPHGHVVVLGDNRAASCDSRVWGPLPEKNLMAKLLAIYWPPQRIGRIR